MAKPGWAYCSLNKSCPAIHTQLRVYFLSMVPSTLLTPPSFLRAKTGLGVKKNDAPRQTATHLWAVSTAIFTPSGSLLVCAVFFFCFCFYQGPRTNKKDRRHHQTFTCWLQTQTDVSLSIWWLVDRQSHSTALKIIHGELVVMKQENRSSVINMEN